MVIISKIRMMRNFHRVKWLYFKSFGGGDNYVHEAITEIFGFCPLILIFGI